MTIQEGFASDLVLQVSGNRCLPVVINTSLVLNLAIVGQLDLLHQQFSQV